MALSLANIPTWEQLQANPQLKNRWRTILNDPLAYPDQWESSIGILQKQLERANGVEKASGGVNTGSINVDMLQRALQAGGISGTIAPDSNFFTSEESIKQRFGGQLPSFLTTARPFTPVPGQQQYGVDDYYSRYGTAGGQSFPGSTYTPSTSGNGSGNTGTNGSGLPDSANKMLDVLQDKITNSVINPDVEINSTMIDGFLAQAKQELAPYYGQLFKQADEDLRVGFKQIGEDLASNEEQLGRKYGQDLQATQESLAARGLAFSGIRDKQENDLASQTKSAIEAGRREAERRALDLGTKGERLLGSSQFPTNLPTVNAAPTPITGQAGVYGFSNPSGTRQLFNSVGGTTGTLQQEQLEAEQARQRELTGNERTLRGAYTI